MRKCTIYKHVRETTQPYYISVQKALERIKQGNSRELLEKIRNEQDKAKRRKLKEDLPSICFSGIFRERKDDAITVHSGLVCLDFDDVENPPQTKELICADKYTYAAFISPSGTGIKVLVKIPPVPDDHKQYFLALCDHFAQADSDTSSQNISRVCYESYDPDLYLNINSELWDKKKEREIFHRNEESLIIPLSDEREIMGRLYKWVNSKVGNYDPSQQGHRHEWMVQFAAACNRFGVASVSAKGYMLSLGHITPDKAEDIVKWAYQHTNVFDTERFEDKRKVTQAIKLSREGKSEEDIRHFLDVSGVGDVDADKIINKTNKLKKVYKTFWDVEIPDKGAPKIMFSRVKFKKWAQDQGIFRYQYGPLKWKLIQISEGFKVREIERSMVKEIVMAYITTLPDQFDYITQERLMEFIMKGERSYFNDGLFEFFDCLEINWNRDTRDTVYVYYTNTVVKVTKTGIECISYSDLGGYIWETHIIGRPFEKLTKYDNDFEHFCRLVCNKDPQRLKSLQTVTGYLLSGFKDQTEFPLVIFNDEIISDHPNGGTGKGLFNRGIKELRRTVVFDGKNFSLDATFVWQRVNLDTQYILFDDAAEGFPLERLFSVISEGMPVQKKGQDEFYIPFEDLAKMGLNTNYDVSGVGGSFERRRIDLEFSQYFNNKHTPLDEFKRLLFDSWSDEEWMCFDNYMVNCIQLYLNERLVRPELVNLHEKRFISSTCTEFVLFSESIVYNVQHNRKELKQSFVAAFPDFDRLSQRKFNSWVMNWAQYKGVKVDESRTGNDFIWTFRNPGDDSQIESDPRDDGTDLPF